MSNHVDRARLLMAQSRMSLAEDELRQALMQNHGDGEAHALLAVCLVDRDDYETATYEAQQAIVSEPDQAFGYRALSHVMFQRNRPKEAYEAIVEAIRIEPWHASNFGQLAAIELERSRWQDALDASEQGLQCDPEDVECNNLRAIALVKLGRREEAGATIDAALANEPDNAVTHANLGWTMLHSRQPKKAAEHFREALRLDPNSEWARVGVIEAMKARNFIYRWMLAFFLWMNRLPPKLQVALVLGMVFSNSILNAICGAIPALAPFQLHLLLVYLLFVWMTWVAPTLFNMVLYFSKFGRMVLRPIEKAAALTSTLCIVAGAGVAGSVYTVEPVFFDLLTTFFLIGGMHYLGLVMPVSRAFQVTGKQRRTFVAYSIGLLAITLTMTFHLYQIPSNLEQLAEAFPADEDAFRAAVQGVFEPFQTWSRYGIWGLVIFTWIGFGSSFIPDRK